MEEDPRSGCTVLDRGVFLVRLETADAKSFSSFSSDSCEIMEERFSSGSPTGGFFGGVVLLDWGTGAASGSGRCSP